MPNHDHNDLIFYPAYCFPLSPTYNTWVRIASADVHALKERVGFEGQDTYFYLNHPIKWIRLVGVVVAFDILPTRFIYTLDDSSGATIEVTCERPKAQPSIEEKNVLSRSLLPSMAPTRGITARGGLVDLLGIDIGTVVKVKGGIRVFRDERQVSLERISVIRTTVEEVSTWVENNAFRNNILDQPWIVSQKEEYRAKRIAEGRSRKPQVCTVDVGRRTKASHNRIPKPPSKIGQQSNTLRIEKENLTKQEVSEKQREQEKQKLERLERTKEMERRKQEIAAARVIKEAELEKEQKRLELEGQRKLAEQQRQAKRLSTERNEIKKKRDADRSERERIFAERSTSKSTVLGVPGAVRQSKKDMRTDHT